MLMKKCFMWCVQYPQINNCKHGSIRSVLNQIDDKYNYDSINYPPSYDDIATFEKTKSCQHSPIWVGRRKIMSERQNKEARLYNYWYNNFCRLTAKNNSHYVYKSNTDNSFHLHTHMVDKQKMLCPCCTMLRYLYMILEHALAYTKIRCR